MDQTSSVFVSVLGKPNVGKSTLTNALVGEKVAIVSPKPQTTRNKITGILTVDQLQYVFFDTPGYHTPKNRLSEHMMGEVRESTGDIDVALFVTDCTSELSESEQTLLKRLEGSKIPVILVLNKTDKISDKSKVFQQIASLSETYGFTAIVPISAKNKVNLDVLLSEIRKFAIPSPHCFDSDSYTTNPERTLVAELVREKILLFLGDEIPHGCAVVTERFQEASGSKKLAEIDVIIYCERESHKRIIIGKSGSMLKKISTGARTAIENLLDTKIVLHCFVKIKENWRNSESAIRQIRSEF